MWRSGQGQRGRACGRLTRVRKKSWTDRWVEWVAEHERLYRAIMISIFAICVALNLIFSDGWGTVLGLSINAACLLILLKIWWRQDACTELRERVVARTGEECVADVMWLVATQRMRTRDVAAINTILDRYDLMRTPVDDLPREAKIVRQQIEWIAKG